MFWEKTTSFTNNGHLTAFSAIEDRAARSQSTKSTSLLWHSPHLLWLAAGLPFSAISWEQKQHLYLFTQYLAQYLAHSVRSVII